MEKNGKKKVKMGEIKICASTYVEKRSGGTRREAKFIIHTNGDKHLLWCNGTLNDHLSPTSSYKYSLGTKSGKLEALEWCHALNQIIEQKRAKQYQSPQLTAMFAQLPSVPPLNKTRKTNHGIVVYSYPIPDDRRSNAWFTLSGAQQLMNENINVYAPLTSTIPSNAKSHDQIVKDLPRTFANTGFYQQHGDALRRILVTYCNYNESVQ